MKKAVIAAALALTLLVGCASGPVFAPREFSYVTKTFGEITFEYNERFSYRWSEDGSVLFINFEPTHRASVQLSETRLSTDQFDQLLSLEHTYPEFTNMLLGAVFYTRFEDVHMNVITETIANGKTAFEAHAELLNGESPFNGDFETHLIFFTGINNVYRISYMAPVNMYNRYYQYFRDIVASIRTYE